MKRTGQRRTVPGALEQRRETTSSAEQEGRKERVLTHGRSSITTSIADAVVIKDGNVFFLCRRDGTVPLTEEHGFGLYYNDCRYLNGYDLLLAGAPPQVLASSTQQGAVAVLQLTNPDILAADGTLVIPKEDLGVRWTRTVDAAACALQEQFTVQSFTPHDVALSIALTLRAEFEDVFAVRGMLAEQPGTLHEPLAENGVLRFVYDGADGIRRALAVRGDPAPQFTDAATLTFSVRLPPRGEATLNLSFTIAEEETAPAVDAPARPRWNDRVDHEAPRRTEQEWVDRHPRVRTDDLILNEVLDRSLRDVGILRSSIGGEEYFAAGIPWFATLFGRDSLITAIQMLAYAPDIAEQTLRVLAGYQGTRVDDWRDEEPGKILHELRIGEFARTGEIPHTPYYGTIDATPLFLVLVARHARWTGDLTLFRELRGHVEAALRWLDQYGDTNGDGYVDYRSRSGRGLINQGWKDSGDAIMTRDGELAHPPIALPEVQGYVYLAKVELADLLEHDGRGDDAARLRAEAENLRERFNADFWIAEEGCFALALQAKSRQADVVSSNAGHVLWTGIAGEVQAQRTIARMMQPDMFTGWGVRTLSSKERGFNPIGYHLGTVWPHDTAFIAAGCRRYREDTSSLRLFSGLLEAAMHFDIFRLPELFAGYGRDEHPVPVSYPVACHPQAWAAGAVPFMLTCLLGLQPDGLASTLRIVRPVLPEFTHWLEIRGLRVGVGRVDLRFERTQKDVVVHVLAAEGVTVQAAGDSPPC